MKKILSISSHVVHGYVGNKAVTFPLQLKGWDVDALNTVQFSNHPAYGSFYGVKYEGSELLSIYKKILEVADINYPVILSGYITSSLDFEAIMKIVKSCRDKSPDSRWFLDPIIGDNGKIYIKDSTKIIQLYKEVLTTGMPFLVTPNHFEMEILTDTKIKNLQSLKEAFIKFHKLYPLVPNIVVTSVELDDFPNDLVCAASPNDSNDFTFIYLKVPKINAIFFGSGDLFCGLLVDTYLKNENLLSKKSEILAVSLNEVLSVLHKILDFSYNWELKHTNQEIDPTVKLKVNSLRLIQCKDFFLEHTESLYKLLKYS